MARRVTKKAAVTLTSKHCRHSSVGAVLDARPCQRRAGVVDQHVEPAGFAPPGDRRRELAAASSVRSAGSRHAPRAVLGRSRTVSSASLALEW